MLCTQVISYSPTDTPFTLQPILSSNVYVWLDFIDKYLDTYRQILSTRDHVQMWFFKIILLGAPRLGKTTVRRRLTGEIEDINSSGEGVQPSTGVLESGHIFIRNLSNTSAIILPSEWKALTDLTAETRLFLEYFHGRISEKIAISTVSTTTEGEAIVNSVPNDDLKPRNRISSFLSTRFFY